MSILFQCRCIYILQQPVTNPQKIAPIASIEVVPLSAHSYENFTIILTKKIQVKLVNPSLHENYICTLHAFAFTHFEISVDLSDRKLVSVSPMTCAIPYVHCWLQPACSYKENYWFKTFGNCYLYHSTAFLLPYKTLRLRMVVGKRSI